MKIDILFDLMPLTTVNERLVLKQILDNFTVALDAETQMLEENPNDDEEGVYLRIYKFLESQFDEMDYLCESDAWEVFKVFFDKSVVKSAGYWPNVYIGDGEISRHAHTGVTVTILTLKNMLNLLKAIYSLHFGGYNGMPFVYDDGDHSKFHYNFSNN